MRQILFTCSYFPWLHFVASCTIFGQVDYQKVSLDQSKFRISFTQFVAFTL